MGLFHGDIEAKKLLSTLNRQPLIRSYLITQKTVGRIRRSIAKRLFEEQASSEGQPNCYKMEIGSKCPRLLSLLDENASIFYSGQISGIDNDNDNHYHLWKEIMRNVIIDRFNS